MIHASFWQLRWCAVVLAAAVFSPAAAQDRPMRWRDREEWRPEGGLVARDPESLARAIAQAAETGGTVRIPTMITVPAAVKVPSHVHIECSGSGGIQSTNNARTGGFAPTGTAGAHVTDVWIRNCTITGLTQWKNGAASHHTGSGIYARYCDECLFERNRVSHWSDAGISSEDGSRSKINYNMVDNVGQGVQFFANHIDIHDNELIGNVVTNTGLFNAIHVEGAAGGGPGKAFRTRVIGNQSDGSRNVGLNIEVAPQTIARRNRVRDCGWGRVSVALNSCIKLWGAYGSVLVGNVAEKSTGYGIWVGANSGDTYFARNYTSDNALGSALFSDGGVHASKNIRLGTNSFTEGQYATKGKVSFVGR